MLSCTNPSKHTATSDSISKSFPLSQLSHNSLSHSSATFHLLLHFPRYLQNYYRKLQKAKFPCVYKSVCYKYDLFSWRNLDVDPIFCFFTFSWLNFPFFPFFLSLHRSVFFSFSYFSLICLLLSLSYLLSSLSFPFQSRPSNLLSYPFPAQLYI